MRCVGWILSIHSSRQMDTKYPSVRVHLSPRIEAEAAEFQIQAPTCQAEIPGRLGDIAARPVERRLNQLALHLFHCRREVRRDRCRRAARTAGPSRQADGTDLRREV